MTATVFVVKNRAPHGRKPFFADEKPDFTAIPKECALLLTKQYYTITPFPDQDKKDDSCLTVRSVCCPSEASFRRDSEQQERSSEAAFLSKSIINGMLDGVCEVLKLFSNGFCIEIVVFCVSLCKLLFREG